jgi:hypothetical protein
MHESEVYRRAVWRGEDGREYKLSSIRNGKTNLEYLDSNYKWQMFSPAYILTLFGVSDDGIRRERCTFSAHLMTGTIQMGKRIVGRYDKFAVDFHNESTYNRRYNRRKETIDEIADRLAQFYFSKAPEQRLLSPF